MKYTTFIFERYSLDAISHVAEFVYAYEDGPTFVERLTVPSDVKIVESETLDRALFALHLLLGVSYWKAYCPKNIVVKSGTLSTGQANFWNTVYTKGLGQFFYENNLEPQSAVNFHRRGLPPESNPRLAHATGSSPESLFAPPEAPFPVPPAAHLHPLVPMGGGKDSLVTIALLKQMNIPFHTYSLGTYPIIEEQRKHIDAHHFTIQRQIDSQLFTLPDAYNGHVPITTIYSFTALLIAILNSNTHLVLSNERSASEGNVEYRGETINHQWSKSWEAEQLIRDYVSTWITPEVEYFSLLRPLSELQIAKLFAQHPEWLPRFTSCNTNFKILEKTQQRWCGHCPKCVFVFTMLAPFVPKEQLVHAFGKNLFADATLLPLFQELLGVKNFKPFECVGTPDEMRAALTLAAKNGAYANDTIMQYTQHTIPTANEEMINSILTPSHEHDVPKIFQSDIHER